MSDNPLWPFWLMAVVLHGVVAAYYFGIQQDKPIELTGEGGTGIEVGLDHTAYQTLMRQQAKVKQQADKAHAIQQAQKQLPKPIKRKQVKTKKQAPKPKKIAKQPALKPVAKTVPMRAVSTTASETAVEASTAQKVAMVTPAKTNLNTPATTLTDAVNASQNSATSMQANSNATSDSTATNNSSEKAMGTPAPLVMNDATKRYIRKLMRHLSQFKEYPSTLKKAHIEGTPIIRFTFNQAGEILETTIKKRSNNKALDKAAIEVFKKANPLPPIPQALKRDTLTMSLPIKFNLIND